MEGGHFRPRGTVVPGTSGFGALELLAKRHGRCFFKPEKCFWYLLDYVCEDGELKYTEMVPRNMTTTNPDGTQSPIRQEMVTEPKKTLGIHNSPSGGNATHLSSIKTKSAE
jgi:hypothetical protein